MSMSLGYSVGTPVSEDVNNSFHKFYVDPLLCCTSLVNGNNTVNDVETCLTKFLNIQDNNGDNHKQISSSSIPSNSNSSNSLPLNGAENQNMPEEEKEKEKEKEEPLYSDKCAAISVYHKNVNKIEGDNVVMAELITDFESVEPFLPSLPDPSKKLVSSMKGKREKPLQQKSVTWAADVYDPVPTSVSHFLSNKSQRHHHRSSSSSSSSSGKKHSKSSSKHKGSSSKTSPRSTGKDKKKQAHRSSSRSHKDERVHGADFYNTNSALGFDVSNSPEAYCGTSFLKETLVSKLHFSVAEAT